MQFKPFVPGIEVNGQTVYAVVDGFRLFRRLAASILADEGIGRVAFDGDLLFDRSGWYCQAAWLRAFARIADEAGPGALLEIGKRIPENARFPPTTGDIHSGLEAINVAYHLNHRRDGVVMYDAQTGETQHGIGSYGCRAVGERMIMAECKNPYPCAFDRGIITAMAYKFDGRAQVEHAPGECRQDGGEACSYMISC